MLNLKYREIELETQVDILRDALRMAAKDIHVVAAKVADHQLRRVEAGDVPCALNLATVGLTLASIEDGLRAALPMSASAKEIMEGTAAPTVPTSGDCFREDYGDEMAERVHC